MINMELEKAKAHIVVEIIEYIPDTVVVRSIIEKTTGNISAFSFDSGKILAESINQFDTLIQIVDGCAEILINGCSNVLETGQSIVIPAYMFSKVKANERFKMISTIIKNAYV
jgi:quercetin dioxygenase-like cupin family protein